MSLLPFPPQRFLHPSYGASLRAVVPVRTARQLATSPQLTPAHEIAPVRRPAPVGYLVPAQQVASLPRKRSLGLAQTPAETSPMPTRHVQKFLRSTGARMSSIIRDDRGAATAEYAVVIMAAVGFAGLLVVILKGNEIKQILTDLVTRALEVAG